MSKKKLITHNGSYHADDVFACAALILMLRQKGEDWEIIRTRDPEIIKTGDYVFDVGGVYDENANRFDHHQIGGAGKREDGIDYASFGLVFAKFGQGICGDAEVANIVNKKLVSPIDAGDNAIDLVEYKGEIKPYFIQNAFQSFRPTSKNISEESLLEAFLQCVELGKKILSNEINLAADTLLAKKSVASCYAKAEDKRIIVLDGKYPWAEEIINYPEPFFVVFPKVDGSWSAETVPKVLYTFERRINFPPEWGGLRDEELGKISGVPDAVFCHRGLFICVAKSREGAEALANKAIKSKNTF